MILSEKSEIIPEQANGQKGEGKGLETDSR